MGVESEDPDIGATEALERVDDVVMCKVGGGIDVAIAGHGEAMVSIEIESGVSGARPDMVSAERVHGCHPGGEQDRTCARSANTRIARHPTKLVAIGVGP